MNPENIANQAREIAKQLAGSIAEYGLNGREESIDHATRRIVALVEVAVRTAVEEIVNP